jgi:hypothetical protein
MLKISPFLPKPSNTANKRNWTRATDSSHLKDIGREARSEVRETFMGTVFGALEEAEFNPAKSTDITLFQSRSQPSA